MEEDMIKLVSLWNLPHDVAVDKFERYYFDIHVPAIRKIPGQRMYFISRVRPSKRRQVPYYRMAEEYFDDYEALKQSLDSPEAKAAFSDTHFLKLMKDPMQFVAQEEEIQLQQETGSAGVRQARAVKFVSYWNLRPEVSEDEFEQIYYQVHVELTRRLPEISRYVVSKVRPSKRRQVPYRLAELYYRDEQSMKNSFASPQAKVAVADETFNSRVQDQVSFIVETDAVEL
jgi:uncharacterized protein (TIGR02118 family)